MSFIELHARSAFSFLRGASSPEDMVTRAADLEMPCIAITDRDGYYGSARAHLKAKELGLRALVGMELTMEDETVLPLLVATRQGYQNLARLMTRAKLRTTKGQSRVLWSELPEYAEGLVALSGDEEG
uniref:PHP domain-containing protein n=1 Tax=Verrucomicrobium sp. BvORR106 TaxID=1403819 RepID=UPI0005703EB0